MAAEHLLRWTVLPDGVVGTDPGGGDRLRVSVLVTPRLRGSKRLGDYFPTFESWPDTLAGLVNALSLEFLDDKGNPVAKVTAKEVDTSRYPAADRNVWKALFHAETHVDDHSEPRTEAGAPRVLRSFPAAAVESTVTALFRDMAATTTRERIRRNDADGERTPCERPDPEDNQGWRFPSGHVVIPMIGNEVIDFANDPRAVHSELNKLIDPNGGIHLADSGAAEQPMHMRRTANPKYQEKAKLYGLAEAHRFYDRGPAPAGADEHTLAMSDAPPAPVEPHRVDFHEACGLLGDYPELQRRFGLVVDLVFTAPDGLAGADSVRVAFAHPDQAALNAPGRRPRTRIAYAAGQRFEPKAKDEKTIRTRVLNLGSGAFRVTDLDVDGAALKHLDYARAFAGMRGPDSFRDTTEARRQLGNGTPAARGGGITVFREDDDGHLAQQIGADRTREKSNVDPTLVAEDLVRGYRVDVGIADVNGTVHRWHSLCRRRGSYTIRRPGQPPVTIPVRPDEGNVKASAVTRTAPESTQVYTHQALFGWDGWSLVAPRPGLTINKDNQPEAVVPPVSPDVPLATAFTPEPGSLPALRYGRTYRLRARVVDLAGNSADHTATVPHELLAPAITYLRWEPVPQPVVVPTRPFSEGESAERMVIRSTITEEGREISAREYEALRSDVPDHSDPSGVDGLDRRYRAVDHRHVAPPKVALAMAEEHGVFDAAFGPDRPERARARYFASAAREAGSFLDTVVSDPEDPSSTTDLLREHRIHIAKHDVHDTAELTPLPLTHRGAGLKHGEFVVHDARRPLLLPYLPDPLARGVCLRGLPGTTGARKYPFPGPWPQAKPFLLTLAEGDGEPEWRDGPWVRELTVRLARSETARVFLSCYLDRADLSLLRQWRLLTESDFWRGLAQRDRDFVAEASADGENWMLTPWVELNLVHAVEKPLRRPELRELVFRRVPEATFTEIRGELRAHSRSTAHVAVDAKWGEWVDDVSQPAPQRFTRHAHVEDVQVSVNNDMLGFTVRHEFGDTRHRNIDYTPTATTRFREYFHPAITADQKLITRGGPVSAGHSVPSSRRPEPPEPSHLVPTFRWSRTADREHGTVTSTRRHAGVRLHLRRPWYSSGDDELLAVVLDPGGTVPDRYSTRWGVDPVWSGASRLAGPSPANFPNATSTANALTLAEGLPTPVSVAAFRPDFDERRGLWRCDIDVDLGAAGAAYFPFLRLAVARYQPHSLPGLELSTVVTAEFAQLLPDRTVTATGIDGGLRVTLAGPTTSNELGRRVGGGVAAVAGSRRVTATLQSRASLGAGELDWQPVGNPVPLSCRADGAGFAWSADIPAPDTALLTQYRLLVEEHELHQSDVDTATETVTVAGQPVPVARRLVHADRVALRRRPFGGIEVDLDIEP
ncbi:hypothetical protein [Streptoalloteichus hindustanus]|uniref:Uncharacterized protein n=1 Tax=Streptoalloteichus hindustanus TaxID=2017 RepID=A0A1M5I4V7_STRHI|nr:hypothetical protein [Streptoalloteichus hindustanus]SHG23281.1 hypothetical protein SAMN05444320_107105 [Streptoalloteichus hindustanus]